MFKSFQKRDYSKAKSNDLRSLPFQDLAGCNASNYEVAVADFFKSHALASKPWFYPQLIAHIAKWTLSRSGSMFDGKALVKENCTDDFEKGIYWVSMSDKRALVKQYLSSQYCALTPIIMSAFKTMHGFNYMEWTNLQYVINPSLLEAISVEPPEYSKEELLEFRHLGLTTQTGKDAGSTKSSISTYGIYGLTKELPDGRYGLGSFPQLTRIILLQTWCAHPNNRSKYSILDLKNWDNMPEALIEEQVVSNSPKLNIEDLW